MRASLLLTLKIIPAKHECFHALSAAMLLKAISVRVFSRSLLATNEHE
jgi:hypothetical protein